MAGQIVPDTLRGRVFVAGGDTPLGAALQRRLQGMADVELCGHDVSDATLRDPYALEAVLACMRPAHVIVTAGHSGGITANRRMPAGLMVDNLRVATTVIPAAHRHGVESLLYIASSCTYPRDAAQPMQPEAMFTGPLEPTSEAYATAKIAGVVLCRAFRAQFGVRFISGIAGDLYGPGEDFHPEHSHVVAGLIRRMHEAHLRGDSRFVVWGSGRQVRDLVYVDDLADACLLGLSKYDGELPINLSPGTGTSIAELAMAVRDAVGFAGELVFDRTRPEGAPLKVLDSTVIRQLGFTARTSLRQGVERTYAWFLERGDYSRLPAAAGWK
jgi:GDP-L-fucose synthase